MSFLIYDISFHFYHWDKSCETRPVWGEPTKCTFGFNAQLKDNPGAEQNEKEYTGQFQFNDHNGIKIHLDEIIVFKVCTSGEIKFRGYDKDDVYVKVTVEDEGEPGIGDEIEVRYMGKTWKGVLGGGNIQVH